MSKGSVIIDGVDIDDLGMFITRGGDNDFLPFPGRKEPEANDWHELDGIDVDLVEVYFKERTVTVRFYIRHDLAAMFKYHLNAFYKLLARPGYRRLYSREFDRTFTLRYLSCRELEVKGGFYRGGGKRAWIDVEFVMDDPLQLFTGPAIVEPAGGWPSPSFVKVNGRDLAGYGIIVNACYDTVLRLPAVKSPLARSLERRDGLLVYLSTATTLEKKQVTIECTMRASGREGFYHNYKALFDLLTAPGALAVETYHSTARCYYSGMTGFEKLQPFGRGVSVKFNLVLVQVEMKLFDYLLASEEGLFIVTEEGQYLINMDHGE
jgi:hypothetical protein